MEREEIQQLVFDMVAIPSVNPLDGSVGGVRGEAALAAYVEAKLQAVGIAVARQEAAPGRPSLVARVPGDSPETLWFDAHLDTVTGEGMASPFSPRLDDNTLVGRGSADDKGSLGALMAALIRVARSGIRPPLTVLFTATADEEHGMRGMRGLLASGLRARGAVVAEPTGLEVVVAHKGVARFTVATTGQAAHSSRPEAGVNAIYRMARVVEALEHYAKGGVGRETHPLLGKATLSVGVIRGGEYVNVIPDRCEIKVDRRLLPGEDGRRAVSDVRAYLTNAIEEDLGLDISGPNLVVPGLNMSVDHPWVRAIGAGVKQVTGHLSLVGSVATTHAGFLAEAAIPAVVCGPGSMGQAHTATEELDLDQLYQAVVLYESLMQSGATA
jgi:acetylornithine deacetylase